MSSAGIQEYLPESYIGFSIEKIIGQMLLRHSAVKIDHRQVSQTNIKITFNLSIIDYRC
jgi:hypothetical protein